MPATTPRVETFAVEDGYLVRRVVPARGKAYEHRCPLAIYRELAWSAIDLAADGFTLESLVECLRNRPVEGDEPKPWSSLTNAAVAIAFWKERGIIDTRRRRNYVGDGYFFEDAMIEYLALAESA
jgi:hypothetical protein